jgi:hypothetical protein
MRAGRASPPCALPGSRLDLKRVYFGILAALAALT